VRLPADASSQATAEQPSVQRQGVVEASTHAQEPSELGFEPSAANAELAAEQDASHVVPCSA
jgi:hypothetical protein